MSIVYYPKILKKFLKNFKTEHVSSEVSEIHLHTEYVENETRFFVK